MSAKLLSIKHLFELACKGNILYDANIFDRVLIDYLDPNNQIMSFVGWDNYKEWISSNVVKETNGNLSITKICGQLQSIGNQPAWIEYINDKICNEEWYENDDLHRDNDLPADITYILMAKLSKNVGT